MDLSENSVQYPYIHCLVIIFPIFPLKWHFWGYTPSSGIPNFILVAIILKIHWFKTSTFPTTVLTPGQHCGHFGAKVTATQLLQMWMWRLPLRGRSGGEHWSFERPKDGNIIGACWLADCQIFWVAYPVRRVLCPGLSNPTCLAILDHHRIPIEQRPLRNCPIASSGGCRFPVTRRKVETWP